MHDACRADLRPPRPPADVAAGDCRELPHTPPEGLACVGCCVPSQRTHDKAKERVEQQLSLRQNCAYACGFLAARRGDTQIVLIMDAVRLHFHRKVLDACLRGGIWLVLVPARLTWLLQPCDTHAFQLYKQLLKAAYQRRRMASPTGELHVRDFLPCIFDAIRYILQGRRWANAFDSDGFGRSQAALSPFIQRHLQLDGPFEVPCGEPTEEQLRLCLPARCRLNVALFMRPFAAPKALAAPSRVPLGFRFGPRARPVMPGLSGGAVLARGASCAGARVLSGAGVESVGREPRTRSECRAASGGDI